jgi:hypothetical protein
MMFEVDQTKPVEGDDGDEDDNHLNGCTTVRIGLLGYSIYILIFLLDSQ